MGVRDDHCQLTGWDDQRLAARRAASAPAAVPVAPAAAGSDYLARRLAEILNAALKTDPECLSRLLARAVPTTEAEALRRFHIHAWPATRKFPPVLSVLGLLNGVLRSLGSPRIVVARGGRRPPDLHFAVGDREVDLRGFLDGPAARAVIHDDVPLPDDDKETS